MLHKKKLYHFILTLSSTDYVFTSYLINISRLKDIAYAYISDVL